MVVGGRWAQNISETADWDVHTKQLTKYGAKETNEQQQ